MDTEQRAEAGRAGTGLTETNDHATDDVQQFAFAQACAADVGASCWGWWEMYAIRSWREEGRVVISSDPAFGARK